MPDSGAHFGVDILEAFPEAVVAVDRDWRVFFVNQVARESAGRSLIGETFWSAYPKFNGARVEAEFRRAMSGDRPVHIVYGERDGRCIELRGTPIPDGLAIVWRLVSSEGPDPLGLAHEIKRLDESLNERVRERTEELEAANLEMEGFTYSVSHDLRAPLRAIISTSMILLEESTEGLSPQGRDLLRRQAAAAKKMGVLIDELLKLSRLSRQEMVSEPLNLSLIAKEIAHELASDRCVEGISFEIEPDLDARGDARLLRLVLVNLMENACKFSPEGGAIAFGKEGEAFYVRDKGIGFDMAYVDKVFQPFERLVTDSEYPGTGIGLANVRRIVQRHGGRVWAEAEPGQGATFYFTLG